ncbi:MAG: class I SAM-dependent methyltransferase [Planctomycetota bacterium]|nr:class I SAM-dependent methyltransferase [Planctomycetota bacterium]
MTTSQQKTIETYQRLAQANAMIQTYRLARKLGIFKQLQEGQKTGPQIAAALNLAERPTGLLMDQLAETGFIEKYGQDYALSVLGKMLPAELGDLGDRYWCQLEDWVRYGNRIEVANASVDETDFGVESLAFEWMETPNALELIEILNIGQGRSGLRVVELACGSGVFSSAMAYHDPQMKVCLVDQGHNLAAAKKTTVSIGVDSRFQFVDADPTVFRSNFKADLVLITNRMCRFDQTGLEKLFRNVCDLLHPEGEVVVVDEFCESSEAMLSHRINAILAELRTPQGQGWSRKALTEILYECGFADALYSDLKSPPSTKGVLVAGVKSKTRDR